MIPKSLIQEWKKQAPWKLLQMVEQDLILSRVIILLFNNQLVQTSLAFRGGTALYKGHVYPPQRYSEDLDFVQLRSEPIGNLIHTIRSILDPLLGKPAWRKNYICNKLIYRYTSFNGHPMKLKIEINTREHFQVQDLLYKNYSMESEWYTGEATITTYQLEELMATKMRALFQRRKGRDLFDVDLIFRNNMADINQTITIFQAYCQHNGTHITGKQFHQNMLLKRATEDFGTDMELLLPESTNWDFNEAFEYVLNNIITKIP